MNARFSRIFLAGGQNAVPLSGWFFGGWSPGTTLALFWFENLLLTLFIGARVAAHWQLTRKRGHERGFLKNFLVTSVAFTLAQGVFLVIILGALLRNTVVLDDVWTGLQWMAGTQVASLALDSWSLGRWPFAELRTRTEWMLGRVVMVHLSIIVGMFVFAAMGTPTSFFGFFLVFKALAEISSIVPQWKPKKPPAWLARLMNKVPGSPEAKKRRGKPRGDHRHANETFEEYWERTDREEAEKYARDEEVVRA